MKNLIRAQLYQVKRNKLMFLLVAVILFTEIVTVVLDNLEVTLGQCMAKVSLYLFVFAAMGGAFTAILCVCSDFLDKTSNYEILNGHTRLEIFASRSIVAMILGIITYVIEILIPIFVGAGVLGFGNELETKEIAIRLALSVIVEMRILAIVIAVSYMVKKFFIVLALTVYYFIFSLGLAEIYVNSKSYLMGVTCFVRLSEYVSWTTYIMGEKIEMIDIYGVHLQAGEGLAMVLSSLGAALVALIIGYYFFKRDDLR